MRKTLVERLYWISGWIYDFSKAATIVLAVGVIIHYFFLTVLVVRGRSMQPNYYDGQVVLVNKVIYEISSPKRGDVVAMYFPGETEKHFIKRVIGIPGDTVEVSNNKVYLNGEELLEPYLADNTPTLPNSKRTLENNEYLVFGDNRTMSSDSRAWGTVPESFIIGRADGKVLKLASKLVD